MLNLFSRVLPAILSPNRRILLHVDSEENRHNETIDIHYSDSGGTNNINFSFVTRMSIPIPDIFPLDHQMPVLAFSSDGSTFAMAMGGGTVSLWDIRNLKVPLKTFIDVPDDGKVIHLQFSSGKLGKEILVFVEVCLPMFSQLGGPNLESLERLFILSCDHSCGRYDIV